MFTRQRFSPSIAVKFSQLRYRSLLIASLMVGGNLLAANMVFAASPTPGTVIQNQATGSYTDTSDGSTKNVESDIVTVTVAEVAGITITPASIPTATAGSVANFDFTIANVGNDPTKFFLPTAPSSVVGGTAGTLQVVGYIPAGGAQVTLASPIDITTAGDTGALSDPTIGANTTLGSIPAGAAIIVRVPVTVSAAGGSPVTVTLGNTTGQPATSNTPYVAQTNDVYTVDNLNGAVGGEAAGEPINGDTLLHRQEASATQSVNAIAVDYGDAPDTGTGTLTGNYRTQSSDNGPNHIIISTLKLGATAPDADDGLQQNSAATADGTDEDAFTSLPNVPISGSYSLKNVPFANTTGNSATLHAWVDFNKNGGFEATEYASATVANNATTANLSWTVPGGTSAGTTYARFRLTTQTLIDNAGTAAEDERSLGAASDGEVEDYQVEIVANAHVNVLLVKRITTINGNTTNGTVSLNSYDPDPTYPYDKNVIQPGITPPTTDKWPNTIGNPLSSTFLLGARDGGVTKLGDEVEYTIYFLSAGTSTAQAVQLCDRIPNHQAFVPNSYNFLTPGQGVAPTVNADRGIALSYQGSLESYTNLADGDIAQYYPPGQVPLPDVCKTVANPNVNSNPTGAVVVNLGLGATGTTGGEMPSANDPGSTNTAYGFVRFKVKNISP
jgi:uncharacterized repeat protein (TIGR01451 family)